MDSDEENKIQVCPPAPTLEPPAKTSIAEAPLEVILFGIFAAVVTVVDLTTTFIGPKSVHAAIVPYTGWVASMAYMNALIFVTPMIFSKNWQTRTIFTITMFLFFYAAMGITEFFIDPVNDSANPYLRVSPLRPIWTVVIPLCWAAVLHLAPKLRRSKS